MASVNRQKAQYVIVGILAGIGVLAIFAVVFFTGRAALKALSEPTPTSILAVILTPGSLPTGPAGEATQAAVESAGQIVYTCFIENVDQLCLMAADGSGQVQLTDEIATDWYASIGPGSDRIVFSSRRGGSFDIYSMALDGTDVRQLTQDYGAYAPEISPDGSRIVFAAETDGDLDIFVMGIDGSNPVRLTDNTDQDLDPSWSPDGSMILFASNRTGVNELYIMNADGSNVRQVTSGSLMGSGGRSDWSPDGATLAFYAGPEGDRNIFTVPAACADVPPGCGPGEYTQLTFGGNNKAPSWSPDGQWIAFASNLLGDNDVFIMRADGTDWRQLTDNDSADWQPRWGPAAP
jgi:TolB protein